MPTENLYFDGKVQWCRPHTLNEWNKYSTKFYPYAPDLEKFKTLKIMNVFSKDDDGEYIRLNCPKAKEIKGKIHPFYVDVIDKDGKPFKDAIGNGTDATVKIEYYSYKPPIGNERKHAIRWTGMRINNLVPFEKTDRTAQEQEAVGGLEQHPRPF